MMTAVPRGSSATGGVGLVAYSGVVSSGGGASMAIWNPSRSV